MYLTIIMCAVDSKTFRALEMPGSRVRKRPLSLTSFLFQMETEGEECGDDNGLIALEGFDSSLNQDATWLLTSSFIDPCSGEEVYPPACGVKRTC